MPPKCFKMAVDLDAAALQLVVEKQGWGWLVDYIKSHCEIIDAQKKIITVYERAWGPPP